MYIETCIMRSVHRNMHHEKCSKNLLHEYQDECHPQCWLIVLRGFPHLVAVERVPHVVTL